MKRIRPYVVDMQPENEPAASDCYMQKNHLTENIFPDFVNDAEQK